ncbi:Tripeptidyl-peptidase I [Ceratobasidium theobromae]|uniref:tripeptidyl-peptidase II n=1 Tax=Ceratobasidium theobromae TaxID=1582974 RepID=A0A5N5QJF6_9AGAM|nr:Tripeptidyl-peptidase I [Ceratobasidium theobromae]
MHVLLTLSLALVAAASPLSQEFATRHALRGVPSGWSKVARAPAEHKIDLRIGLKQARMDDLLAILGEVSDPANAHYGKHLSKSEVDELVAPRRETVQSVEGWLDSHGVAVVGRSSAGDWIHVTIPVSRAEQMLNTKYNIYRHTSGSHIVRSESYALPRSLDSHIDVIQPTTFFGSINERDRAGSSSSLERRASTVFVLPNIKEPGLDQVEDDVGKITAAVPSSCGSTITPACLRALYRTNSYVPTAGSSNTIGITGYLDQYANEADLQTFYKKYRTDAVGSTFSVELVNGGQNNQSKPGVEANLDVQYAGAITYPTPNIFYSTAGSPPYIPDSNTPTNTNEPYLDWVNYVLSKYSLPQTISTSYGDDEQTVPLDYAIRVCNSFAQLGARGVSVLFASGDFGVGAGDCKTNDGTNRTRFQPTFPASCPFVTTVGATYKVSPEIGVAFSQGGFSNYFARPSYQDSAVTTFLSSLGTTYSGMYNATGRGFPDVSAQGRAYGYIHFIPDSMLIHFYRFQIVQNGTTASVAGTSASCPTFAGVIALLNDYRLSQGRPSLGFLNPLLYSNASSALNDITSGNNPGCGTSGFTARAGWDPVTGLGTPDFVKLQAVV